jgi:hypothetical protein
MKVYVVVIVIHEDPYIREFLDHYFSLGIDKMVVYDNSPSAVMSVLSEDPRVLYHHFPGKQKQMPAYIHFIEYCRANPSEAPDFVGFTDADEFLVLKRHPTIQDFLTSTAADCSGVAIPWRMYGNCGLTTYDPRPVVERFPTPATGSTHDLFKSFVRPLEVRGINNPHFFYTTRGTRNAAGTKVLEFAEDPCEDAGGVAVLNHYFTKSYKEFMQKRARGRSDIASTRAASEFFEWASFL